MSILLGLSLAIGAATVAYSQGKEEPKKETKKKGKKTKAEKQ
jgi:ABC-type cobalt transport system substrate-binding protein